MNVYSQLINLTVYETRVLTVDEWKTSPIGSCASKPRGLGTTGSFSSLDITANISINADVNSEAYIPQNGDAQSGLWPIMQRFLLPRWEPRYDAQDQAFGEEVDRLHWLGLPSVRL